MWRVFESQTFVVYVWLPDAGFPHTTRRSEPKLLSVPTCESATHHKKAKARGVAFSVIILINLFSHYSSCCNVRRRDLLFCMTTFFCVRPTGTLAYKVGTRRGNCDGKYYLLGCIILHHMRTNVNESVLLLLKQSRFVDSDLVLHLNVLFKL